MLFRSLNKSKTPIRLILLWSAIITLAIYPEVMDPINSVKFWCLLLLTGMLLGKYYRVIFLGFSKVKIITIPLLLFLIGQIFSILTMPNIYTGIFGDFQRRLGFITYFCLVIIFLLFTTYYDSTNFNKIIYTLFFTVTVVTLYGFLQHFGIDFVKWVNPYNSVISTLGNPNFSSAFMGSISVFLFSILKIGRAHV